MRLIDTTAQQAGEAAAAADGAHPDQPNQFAVRDLLELAGTTYEMVKQTGCILSIALEWNCYVDDVADCVPTVHVRLTLTLTLRTPACNPTVSQPATRRTPGAAPRPLRVLARILLRGR